MEAATAVAEPTAPVRRDFMVEFRYRSERDHRFEVVRDVSARDALTRFTRIHEHDDDACVLYRVKDAR